MNCSCFHKEWALFFFFLADGFSICREGCLLCSMGCCYFVIHGVARFLYSKVAYCRRSWDSTIDTGWSWGEIPKFFTNFSYFPWNIHACLIFDLLFLNLDLHQFPVKCNDSCDSPFCCKWMDSNKNRRLWCIWNCWGLY